eukprot:CAMPEP_0182450678 /NCGR_PEP_ID=MMETSP1172-20130603/42906_1 /TAXON_ID=708627 /ORGANISM="Timspurckia oligopyrenoides, Strain CCMP3278" /LENGTH=410 /DNA_ID=CAMNT_0024648371 /DNA_START=77 /DNA_END=1309 /DNA_ORIENTATION=+
MRGGVSEGERGQGLLAVAGEDQESGINQTVYTRQFGSDSKRDWLGNWSKLIFGIFCVLIGIFVFIMIEIVPTRSKLVALDYEVCDKLQNTKLFFKRRVGTAMCADHDYPLLRIPNSTEKSLDLLVFGDWGRDGFCCQRDVAQELDRALLASNSPSRIIINTGDNFYPVGIQSASDSQVQTSFYDVYTKNFQVLHKMKWYSVLGNHDHLGNFKANLDMYKADKERWHMPSRWYTEEFVADGVRVLIVFLDTTPIFYSPNEGEMTNHNAEKDDGEKQIPWLKQQLKSSSADWKLVVGHHPLSSSGSHALEEAENIAYLRKVLHPIFEENKVAAYFCGHDHDMQFLKLGSVNYIVSGAGSKIRPLIGVRGDGAKFGVAEQGFVYATVNKDIMDLLYVNFRGAVVYSHSIPRPV